jgi:hypothetical protein
VMPSTEVEQSEAPQDQLTVAGIARAGLPQLVALGTGAAYLLGAASVSTFASGLGISPSDLELEVRDQLLIAGVYFVPGIIFAVAFYTLFRNFPAYALDMRARAEASEVRSTRIKYRSYPFVLVLCAAVTMASLLNTMVPAASLFSLVWAVAIVCTFPLIASALHHPHTMDDEERRRERVMTRSFIAVSAALVFLLPQALLVVAASDWGEDLRANPENPSSGWSPLRLIIHPNRGWVFSAGERACVLRVAPDVVVGSETVMVTSIERFAVDESCPLTGKPFD